jgi:hypothetical protein
LPGAVRLWDRRAAEEIGGNRKGAGARDTQISSMAPRVTERARPRDLAPPGWWRWVSQAAVVWALGYGSLRIYWALGDAPSRFRWAAI